MAEPTASGLWSTVDTEGAQTTLSWVAGFVGQARRIDTTAGFEFHIRFQPSSPINTASSNELRFYVRVRNPSPFGWQINVPVLTLEDTVGGRMTLTPAKSLFPVDGAQWVSLRVPLGGGSGWAASGTVDRSRVNAIDWMLDTWDFGYTVDIDALTFTRADAICSAACPSNCSAHGQCGEWGKCTCDLGYDGPSCSVCSSGFSLVNGSCQPPNNSNFDVWPNPSSRDNGDAWLRAHHDQVKTLQPKLLVLDFVNTRSEQPASTLSAVQGLIQRITDGFKTGSRFHGYENTQAPSQLLYQVLPIRDLRDGVNGRPPPPTGWPYENSTLYPRRPPGSSGNWTFDYAKLFTTAFAPLLGFPDPSARGRFKTLCQLVESGSINELWIVGSGDVPDVSAAEVLEAKPNYSPTGNRLGGTFNRCTGNGCFDSDVPTCNASLRIGWVNYNRGPGCYLHSEGHGIESTALQNTAPRLSEWLVPFASLNLDQHYGLPFNSLYTTGNAAYPDPTTAQIDYNGQTFTVTNYDAVCGNVHFPPNGRSHYDYDNPSAVLSSCRAYGSGPICTDDPKTQVSSSNWAEFIPIASDCGGEFLVWWYQNMPGFQSGRQMPDGRPMKSIWPFLFY